MWPRIVPLKFTRMQALKIKKEDRLENLSDVELAGTCTVFPHTITPGAG